MYCPNECSQVIPCSSYITVFIPISGGENEDLESLNDSRAHGM